LTKPHYLYGSIARNQGRPFVNFKSPTYNKNEIYKFRGYRQSVGDIIIYEPMRQNQIDV